jgi:hypothetical protein
MLNMTKDISEQAQEGKILVISLFYVLLIHQCLISHSSQSAYFIRSRKDCGPPNISMVSAQAQAQAPLSRALRYLTIIERRWTP